MPTQLDGYRLVNTRQFDNPADGTMYGFTSDSLERASVIVYAIPSDVRIGENPRNWVNLEGDKFGLLLPVGIQRGWYHAYEYSFGHPDSVVVHDKPVPGFLSAAVTKTGNRVHVQLQYLFVICDRFVKMRVSLDSDTWTKSPFPSFARNLASYLATPRE